LNVDDFLCFNNTTNELPAFGQLFRVWVALPNTERIALGILADGEVAHLRHRRFSHADFPAQFGDFIRVLVYRIHADVIHDWLLQMLASLQRAIGSIIGTTSVNVPILASTGKWIDLPAKQIAIKRCGALRIVRRNFKPNDVCSLLFL